MNLKKGVQVKILSGKDKGKTGRIIKVVTDKHRVVVEGLNMVSKHQRPTQDNPQGGIVQTEASIHHSNVMLIDKNKTMLNKLRLSFFIKLIHFFSYIFV